MVNKYQGSFGDVLDSLNSTPRHYGTRARRKLENTGYKIKHILRSGIMFDKTLKEGQRLNRC